MVMSNTTTSGWNFSASRVGSCRTLALCTSGGHLSPPELKCLGAIGLSFQTLTFLSDLDHINVRIVVQACICEIHVTVEHHIAAVATDGSPALRPIILGRSGAVAG
jgi:hypothetical protein